MANENASGTLRIYNDGTNNEIWVGDDRIPTVGPLSRAAIGLDAPFTLVGTLSATTGFPTLTLQVTSLEGAAVSGVKKITVFPHDGAFTAIAVTYTSASKGKIINASNDISLQFITDTTGALTTRLQTGAAKDNFACACFCGSVYGAAAAISVT